MNQYWRPLAAILLFAGGLAQAADSVDPTGDLLRRERERQEEEARRRRADAPDMHTAAPPVEPFALPQETPCFVVRSIELEDHAGNRSGVNLSVDKFVGKCVGQAGLNLILKHLTQELLDRGYITSRVALPEQNLGAGTLRIVVISGRVHELRYATPVRGVARTAFPISAGDVLNVRDIDQGVEQWKRVPSQDVEVKIVPADNVGESDIVLNVKREKPWRASFTIDNAGTEATGKYQGTGTFSFDNAAGFSDLASITYSHNVDRNPHTRASQGGGLTYSVPWGYATFDLAGSFSAYHQTIWGTNAEGFPFSFQYRGRTQNFSLGAERVIHRNQSSKTTLSLRLSKTWSRTFLDDVEIEVQRRNTTAGELGARHRHYLGKAVLDLGVTYRRGLGLFAQADPPGKVTTRYDMGLADASIAMPFMLGVPLRFSLSGRAQVSPDRLLAADLFSVGGRDSVRGFEGRSSLTGERGFFLRSELGLPIDRLNQTFYVGADYGHVYGPASWSLPGRGLAGAVLGLRGAHTYFFYDLTIGVPVSKPRGLDVRVPVLTFRLTGQL